MYEIIKYEEGFKEKPYYCSEGYVTVGFGSLIGPKGAPLEYYTFTVDKEIAELMMLKELKTIPNFIHKTIGEPKGLNTARRDVLYSMVYQLGEKGFLGFKKMVAAIKNGDWQEAAIQALDSKWAREQTPERAIRHAEVLRSGTLDVYKGLLGE